MLQHKALTAWRQWANEQEQEQQQWLLAVRHAELAVLSKGLVAWRAAMQRSVLKLLQHHAAAQHHAIELLQSALQVGWLALKQPR